MSEEERIYEILSTIRKIEESKQPVIVYFNQNSVPFSRAQYYRYRTILQKCGEEGLRDARTDGNYTKLTERIKDYVITIVKENRSIASSQLQSKILNQFNVQISLSSLNNFRASTSLTRLPTHEEENYKRQKSSGGEILTSLSFFTHIVELYTLNSRSISPTK